MQTDTALQNAKTTLRICRGPGDPLGPEIVEINGNQRNSSEIYGNLTKEPEFSKSTILLDFELTKP